MALVVVGLLVASCDVEFDSSDGDPPTPIVITSTPVDSSGDNATSTPGESDGPNASATVSDNGDPTSTPGEDAATEVPTEQDDPTPRPTESPATNETRQEIEAIESDVVELRGLDILSDVDEQIIDREELARRIEEILNDEYSPEEARLDTLTYWLLRLVPDRDLDLFQLQIDLLSEQVAGYYDPETGELVVVTDDGDLSVSDKVTMAHEIVHALQDQHFDLIAIDEFALDSDHDAAITALIEGDATLSMTNYMLGYLDPLELASLFGEALTGGDTDILDNAPRYISDGLLFSYDAGQTFATALFDEGGYDAIDAAFADPPTSTEQILHPEKYIEDRDDPIEVGNPDISRDLGDGWELVRGDALGEWDFRIMLEENGIAGSTAESAAEGWGGSWFDIYESGDDALGLLTTRWDSDQDAEEFADAIMDTFGPDAEYGSIWFESDRYFSVVAGSDTVVIISATDEAAVERVLAIVDQTV